MADLYVVRRRKCVWEDYSKLGPPLAAVFPTRERAAEKAIDLSRWYGRTIHPRVSPFWVDWLTPEDANGYPTHELKRITTLPVFALRDWLLEAGFPDYPPNPMPAADNDKLSDWDQWLWLTMEGGEVRSDTGKVLGKVSPYYLTDEQLGRFWEAMNLFPFYEVAEVDWHPSGK